MNKIIIAGGVAIGLVALYGLKKKSEFENVVGNMDILIDDVKNISIKGANLTFQVNLRVLNNTATNFSINTGSLAQVTKIRLLNNAGKEVGNSTLTISDLSLPANNSVVLKNIPIEIPAMSMIQELGNITNFDKKNYKLEVTIQALGQTYVIEQGLV